MTGTSSSAPIPGKLSSAHDQASPPPSPISISAYINPNPNATSPPKATLAPPHPPRIPKANHTRAGYHRAIKVCAAGLFWSVTVELQA
ncbi:hypothetical protein M422DRAFT_23176 [Sphaerobolus stellatus SS14]|nr:hypothetical protein M422DRAFT_23176 [Sphaerobolus stellatus SS14]